MKAEKTLRVMAWICFVFALVLLVVFLATVDSYKPSVDPAIWLTSSIIAFFNWAFLRVIANISVALQKQNDLMKAMLAKLNKKD